MSNLSFDMPKYDIQIYYFSLFNVIDVHIVRAFGVVNIGKNGTIHSRVYQWYQWYQHMAANDADRIQHGLIYQRGKSHVIQYGEPKNI